MKPTAFIVTLFRRCYIAFGETQIVTDGRTSCITEPVSHYVPEHGSCYKMSQRIQSWYAVNLLWPGTP